ncbi:MAG: UDP-N-acetylmuramate:L-alanyl-gamma-D-glutamyl-meso-diaminopimelate ligase [Janthinobacterium sp.]
MSGIAEVMLTLGYEVSGSDNSDNAATRRLSRLGARVMRGHSAANVLGTDCVVVSSAIREDNPELMEARSQRIPIMPRAAMLAELMRFRRGIAVAGTHGKTTTSAMLAWILEDAGYAPGFLIGGVPMNFGISARLSGKIDGKSAESDFFVIEADEYDTAFFDKRSKFVHYHAKTAIMNNLEYDHADIFPDLHAIETQFHHLVRTVPGIGRLVFNGDEASLQRVLARGCWSEKESFGQDANWQLQEQAEGSFDVLFNGKHEGHVAWALTGKHNRSNALAAIAAARHVGVPIAQACAALATFESVKRRMEVRGVVNNITVYDDFAHHPTAIATTVGGLRQKIGSSARILAVLEPRSNTMKLGAMKDALPGSLKDADLVFGFGSHAALGWSLGDALAPLGKIASAYEDIDTLVAAVAASARPGDQIVVMSNGGFGGVHQKLLEALGR